MSVGGADLSGDPRRVKIDRVTRARGDSLQDFPDLPSLNMWLFATMKPLAAEGEPDVDVRHARHATPKMEGN